MPILKGKVFFHQISKEKISCVLYSGACYSRANTVIRIISMRQIYCVPIKQKFLCKNTEEIIPELAVITQNTPIICSSESEWENFEMMCQLGSQNVLTTSGFKIRDP